MSSISSNTQQTVPRFEAEASTEPPEGLIAALGGPPSFMAALVLSAALAAGAPPAPFTDLSFRKRDYFQAVSSTAPATASTALAPAVKSLFESGASEFFQDGMESAFSRTLTELLSQYGADAISAIADYLFAGRTEPEVVAESLRWLADFGGPETLPKRWALLRYGLRNPSPVVRDGAILGFAALDDPRAKSPLVEARNIEQIKALQLLIDRVIARLGRTL